MSRICQTRECDGLLPALIVLRCDVLCVYTYILYMRLHVRFDQAARQAGKHTNLVICQFATANEQKSFKNVYQKAAQTDGMPPLPLPLTVPVAVLVPLRLSSYSHGRCSDSHDCNDRGVRKGSQYTEVKCRELESCHV